MITVSASKITPGLRCGDIVEATDGTQYFVYGVRNNRPIIEIKEIEKDGYVRPEFLDGKVIL